VWRSLSVCASTALLLLLASPGCAPIGVAAAIDEAEAAFDTATRAGAEARAAYPWWSARAYLELARTAEGRSDYAGAAAFARRARDFAVEATRRVGPAERVKREASP